MNLITDIKTALIPYSITAVQNLYRNNTIHAVLDIGGSYGTALATIPMRSALLVGFSKLMVDTNRLTEFAELSDVQ